MNCPTCNSLCISRKFNFYADHKEYKDYKDYKEYNCDNRCSFFRMVNNQINYYRFAVGEHLAHGLWEYSIRSGIETGTYLIYNTLNTSKTLIGLKQFIPLIIEENIIINDKQIFQKLKNLIVFS